MCTHTILRLLPLHYHSFTHSFIRYRTSTETKGSPLPLSHNYLVLEEGQHALNSSQLSAMRLQPCRRRLRCGRRASRCQRPSWACTASTTSCGPSWARCPTAWRALWPRWGLTLGVLCAACTLPGVSLGPVGGTAPHCWSGAASCQIKKLERTTCRVCWRLLQARRHLPPRLCAHLLPRPHLFGPRCCGRWPG